MGGLSLKDETWPSRLGFGSPAKIWALRLGFGPFGQDLGHGTGIWVSGLEFGPRSWGAGTDVEEEENSPYV